MTTSDRIRYAVPNDIYAALKRGGSISVEEYPRGGITKAAERAEGMEHEAEDATMVLSLALDGDKSPMSTVWFHPDREDRLELIDRARAALDDAEAALLAVGYMDDAGRSDYMSVPQRERNAFEIGRDAGRLLS